MGEACKIDYIRTWQFLLILDAYAKRKCNAMHYQRRPAPDPKPIRIPAPANHGAIKAGAGWGSGTQAASSPPQSAPRKREAHITYCPTANIGSQQATITADEAAEMREYNDWQNDQQRRHYKQRWAGQRTNNGKKKSSHAS